MQPATDIEVILETNLNDVYSFKNSINNFEEKNQLFHR